MRRDPQQPAGQRRERRSHQRPFDLDAADRADVTEEFWGGTDGWSLRSGVEGDDASNDMWGERTGSMRAIRDGFAALRPRRVDVADRRSGTRGGDFERTRSHGIVRPTALPPEQPSDDEWRSDDWIAPVTTRQQAITPTRRTHGAAAVSVSGRAGPARGQRRNLDRDDTGLVPLSSSGAGVTPVSSLAQRLGLGGVDPLLLRLGAIILTGALVVPIALSSRDDGSLTSSVVAVESGVVNGADLEADPAVQPDASTANLDASGAAPAASSAAGTQGATPATATGADASATGDGSAQSDRTGAASSSGGQAAMGDVAETADSTTTTTTTTSAPAGVATAAEPAVRIEPDCALVYTAVAGDSWYRIADAAGVSPGDLLAANLADLDAPIFPGDDICLPAGAEMPQPPSPATTTPSTTPATTAPAATTTTTTAPTTTSAPSAPASTAEVQRLIREIWPDDLEEKALAIAWRESGYQANAYNGTCCWGVFQIYWTAHVSWLDQYGITSTSDLLDARKNITAAYALYQRAGGWGPWGG